MSTSPAPLDHVAVAAEPTPAAPTLDVDVRDSVASALAAERQRLERVIAELGANELDRRSAEEDIGEVASASQHPADVASETFEREVELGLLDEFRAALADLDDAVRRAAEGSYGRCERCRRQIGGERLAAVPATRWCMPCAGSIEREARWRTPGPRRTAGVLVDDEFLARDDEPGKPDGDLSGEEAALTVRDSVD